METFKVSEYNAELHDKFRALGLAPDVAEKLTRVEYFIDGEPFAQCSVVLQRKGTDYRGDVLILATGRSGAKEPGYVCGFAELVDIKPCRGLTPDEWKDTIVPPGADRVQWFAWFFRNPRRVVEMPVGAKKDFYTLIIPKDQITEYPVNLEIGSEEWAKIRKKYGIYRTYPL